MRRLLAPLAGAWFALLATVACGGPDLSAEVAQFASYRNTEAHLACSCPEDLNYPTYGVCIDAFGGVDEDEQTCMAEVLSAEGDAGKDYIDCVNAAWAAEETCLLGNPGCEPGWYDQCAAERTAAEGACTQVGQATQIEFSLCDI